MPKPGLHQPIRIIALIACAALALPACKSTTPRTTSPTTSTPPTAPAPNPTGTDTTSPDAFPLVDRARSGLEVQWWIADDSDAAVGAALFDLADGAAPLPPERARALIENGLRLIRVPLPRLAELQSRLPTVRSLERTWFGPIVDWKPLFTGLRIDRPPLVRDPSAQTQARPLDPVLLIDAAPERVPPGVLRLIGRAWTAASANPAAPEVLRLEAAVQLQTASRDEALAALRLKSAGPMTVLEEGRVFNSTSIDVALERGYVYVLVPESPSTEWKDERTRKREREQTAENPAESRAAGPDITPPRTLGEAMMATKPITQRNDTTTNASRAPTRPLKAIVVLVPR